MRRSHHRVGALLSGLLLLAGCNELLDVDRFSVGDAAMDAGRSDGGMDAGSDGGSDAGSDAGADAGPPDAGPCNEDDPDGDNDGFDSVACGGEDCDDTNRDRNPGATEVCNDVDEDCDPTTLGPDGDGDGAYGLACCNGSLCGTDCNPADMSIRPGATETCDDVDQDCDGAIDETLLGVLGTPILVDADYGLGPGQGAQGVAFSDGFVVVWKSDDGDDLLARFFNRDGTVKGADIVVEDGVITPDRDPRNPRVTLYDNGGLEQVYITWTEQGTGPASRGVHAVRCEIDGSGCGFSRRIVDVDPTTMGAGGVIQTGERIIFYYVVNDRALHVHSIDPTGLTPSSSVVVPAFDGGETGWGPPAYIEGATPHLLFTRAPDRDLDMVPDGGTVLDGGTSTTYAFGQVDVVRVRTAGDLTHTPAEDVFPWDFSDSCRATGGTNCGIFSVLLTGVGQPNQASFFGVEAVAGFETLDGGTPTFRFCGYPLTPRADRAPDRGDCTTVASLGFFADDRGSVVTTAVFTGTRYAIRDQPLTPDTDGSSLVPVPGMDLLLPGTSRPLSMYEGHGVLVGNGEAMSGFDVVVQRIGCEP
ncbi:MAG: MopE-related protein [Sandaracinaceae bacterium]